MIFHKVVFSSLEKVISNQYFKSTLLKLHFLTIILFLIQVVYAFEYLKYSFSKNVC